MTENMTLRRAFSAAITDLDLEAVDKLLATHGAELLDEDDGPWWMHSAASKNNVEVIQRLRNYGISINAFKSLSNDYPPLWSASVHQSLDAVRWLLANGSIVNQQGECGEVCYALQVAAREGPLELVKMLVEAGANINGVSGDNTPLSFALMYNQPEIAEYLRSLGAREPHQIPGAVPSRPEGPIFDYVRRHLGEPNPLALHSVVPADPDIALYCVFCASEVVLFTVGMSDRPMNTPPGFEHARYAELMIHLPDGWSVDTESLEIDPELQWPFQWLLRLARQPFETEDWIGYPAGIIANGEPPEPLYPDSVMTCWLAVEGARQMDPLELPDRQILFYHVVPITTAERDFERREGTKALLMALDQAGISLRVTFDPERPSVV